MSEKTTHNPTAFDDESLPPPDWDPAMDADESWQRMVALMKNADEPPTLSREDSEGIRAALRQQLQDEGLLHYPSAAPLPSPFIGWLKNIFLGGGAAGQTLRLGVVALVAVAATIEFAPVPGVAPSGRAIRTAGAYTEAKPFELAQATISRGDIVPAAKRANNAVGSLEDKKEKDQPRDQMATDATATPVTIAMAPPALGEKLAMQSASAENAFRVDGNAPKQDAESRVQDSLAERQEIGANGGRSRDSSMMAKSARPSSSGASSFASVSAGMPANGAVLTEAMEALQAVKFAAALGNDRNSVANLRLVEQTLIATLSQTGDVPEDVQHVVGALDRYRSADELLEAKDYTGAEATFVEAHGISPDSFIGFLSLFQVARIRYDFTQDFAGALNAYRDCLDEYPRQFMPDDYRAQVRERVETLNRTAANNWEDLRAWSAAEAAPTRRASADMLMQLLRDNPTSTLAPKASQKLVQLMLADAAPQTIPFDDAVKVLAEAVRRREDGPDTARIQFCIGELQFHRALSPAQAIIEYQKALELKPDAELRVVLVDRLKTAASERLTTRTQPAAPPLP